MAFSILAAPTLASAQAAELEAKPGEFALKLSGFENLDLAAATADSQGANSESEVEIGPQYRTKSGVLIAGRAVLNLQARTYAGGSGSAYAFSAPELSLFAIGPFGRIEVGDRAGFPQSTVGFTPSEIAFTAAEFGPDSGARLDPNGRLPTQFLPRALADRINGLTYLGYAARFYDDRSAKLIYVSPRSSGGFYGAISYTPRADADGGGFTLANGARTPSTGVREPLGPGAYRNVVQTALVYNHRTEVLEVSAGATFSDAESAARSGPLESPLRGRSDSLSLGATVTLRDTWTFGISGTYDGFSSRNATVGDHLGAAAPYGVVTSLNYVNGPWVVGGYYQHATADSLSSNLPDLAGAEAKAFRDTVDVGEFGVSYLADKNHDLLGVGRYTDVKLYASGYIYRFRSEGAPQIGARQDGAVFILGARFSFF